MFAKNTLVRGGITLLQMVVALWVSWAAIWLGSQTALPFVQSLSNPAVWMLTFALPSFLCVLVASLAFTLLASWGQWRGRRGRGALPVALSLATFGVLFGVTLLPVTALVRPVLDYFMIANGQDYALHLFVAAFLLPYVWAYLLGLGPTAERDRAAVSIGSEQGIATGSPVALE